MGKKKKTTLNKLSKDFENHCRNDVSKRCILFSKLILGCLNIWPDSKNLLKKWFMILMVISLGIMEFGHVSYILINITDISKMASASTTLSTTFETIVKISTMIYCRDPLNEIITIIWHEFWPSNLVSKERQTEIKWRSNYVVLTGCTFLVTAFFSCAQFMALPLIANIDQLPLQSWYPFDFTVSPLYEIMYIWQWLMNQIVITAVPSFDAFYNSLVMICATQFLILQDVLKNMFTKDFQWETLFGTKDVSDTAIMIKCVQHHLRLIKVCRLIDKSLSHIIFLQFVISSMAICLSSVALIADPSLMTNMVLYCFIHLLQFFIYCSVGSELTYQSEQVAAAAYICDWEITDDFKIRLGLMMIIQRAQRPEALSVGGLMQLSFANFISTVQLSFSFYTLLNSFV